MFNTQFSGIHTLNVIVLSMISLQLLSAVFGARFDFDISVNMIVHLLFVSLTPKSFEHRIVAKLISRWYYIFYMI